MVTNLHGPGRTTFVNIGIDMPNDSNHELHDSPDFHDNWMRG